MTPTQDILTDARTLNARKKHEQERTRHAARIAARTKKERTR